MSAARPMDFMLWALVGVLYAFACLAMMSIGMFILVVAIASTIAAACTLRVWPEIIGLAIGPAAAFLWMAFRTWSMPLCGPGERIGTVVAAASGSWSLRAGAFKESVHIRGCTELNSQVLLVTGVVLIIAAVAAYVAVLRRRAGSIPAT